MDQMLCELCYSSWLDSWVNVALTTGQTDVVFIAVHKQEELLSVTGFLLFHTAKTVQFSLNSTTTAISHCNWTQTSLAWLRLFNICSVFTGVSHLFMGWINHMWSCVITFLHHFLVIGSTIYTFLISKKSFWPLKLGHSLHHQLYSGCSVTNCWNKN